MKWPNRVQEILNELANRRPSWVADDNGASQMSYPGGESASPRFKLNQMLAEQVRWEFGPNYGLKQADRGRPISSETLAYMSNLGVLVGWSWENQHNGRVDQFPESEELPGQVFVDVSPVNHLNTAPAPPAPVIPSTTDLVKGISQILENENEIRGRVTIIQMGLLDSTQSVISRLTTMEAEVRLLKEAIQTSRAQYPDYQGQLTLPLVGTRTVTLKPVKS